MLKYIFGGIFIALAWAAVLVFKNVLPLWPAIVVTALIVLGLAAYVLIKIFASQKAALAIEKGLKDAAGSGDAAAARRRYLRQPRKLHPAPHEYGPGQPPVPLKLSDTLRGPHLWQTWGKGRRCGT